MSDIDIADREPIRDLPEPEERVRLRQRFGVTQEEVARALKVTRKTVSSWEQGISEPTGERRTRYANLLQRWQTREGGNRENLPHA